MLVTEILDTQFGAMEVPVNEPFMYGALKHTGAYCLGEAWIYQSIIQSGWTILDIGANIGIFSLVFAKATGNEGRVIAYEPQPAIHQILARNLEANASGIDRVQAIVSDIVGERPFLDLHDLSAEQIVWLGSVSVESTADGRHGRMIDTPVVTIDSLNLDRCDFIKIDVEGHEPEVIRGAWETISKHRPVLSIEAHMPDMDYGFIDRLTTRGYRFWLLRSFYVVQTDRTQNPLIIKGFDISQAVSKMLICAPDERITSSFNRWEGNIKEIRNAKELTDEIGTPLQSST